MLKSVLQQKSIIVESTTIKIFIGSPSDTLEERSKIKSIIDELNQTLGSAGRIYIKPVMWEYDVTPTIGKDAQDVINSQTRDYDIFVGIMWKKYGYPTPRADSATAEEYMYALDSFKNEGHCKDIIFMFSNRQFGIDEVDPDQIQKVQEFKRRVASEGVLYKTYTSTEDFSLQLRVSLYKSIEKLIRGSNYRPQISQKTIKNVSSIDSIDERTKLVFDTLTISPAVNNVKSKFIESYILLFLFDRVKATSTEIVDYLCKKLRSESRQLYSSALSRLNQSGKIVRTVEDRDWSYLISEATRNEIKNLKQNAEKSNNQAVAECKAICQKYDLGIDDIEVHNYICNLFATNYSVDNGGLLRGAVSREKSLRQMFLSLVEYIHAVSNIPASFAEPIAKEFVSVYSKNQSFYKANISKMFLNLFQNEKLEEYLSNTKRDLMLDTQVLLQICCVAFDYDAPLHADVQYNVGLRFWESVKSNPMINLYTTSGYIQEVAAHMQQAFNLSRFLSLEYIADLGKSKNIFFNHYMMDKDDMGYSCFEDYVAEMLDVEPYEIDSKSIIDIASEVFSRRFDDLSITIIRHQEVDEFASFKKEYETELSYVGVSRSYEARINDINAAIIAGNYFEDFQNVPYLVTHDSAFIKVRDRFADKFSNLLSFWYVFSPQKISEMLSLIHFKVDPMLVDENIISLTENSFNTSNDTISFIDLLNSIIDQKELGDWKLAAKLSRLRKLCKANFEGEKMLSMNLPIDEILSDILNTLISKQGVPMSDIKELFCDNDYADRISGLIKQELENHKMGSVRVSTKTYDKLKHYIVEKKSKKEASKYI